MLIVDAGNAAQSDLWWKIIEYKYLITGYQMMGYQLLNFGFYEQFIPEEELKKILKNHKDLPFIGANVTYKDKTTFTEPYKILEYKGLKIGFLGITDYFRSHKHYEYTDHVKAIEKYMPELKSKSDIQVLLASFDEADARKLVDKFPDFELIFFGGKTTEFKVWKKSSLYGPFGLGKNGKAPFFMREGEVGRFQLIMKFQMENGELVKIDTQEIELDESIKNDPKFNKFIFETMEKELDKENRARTDDIPPPGDNEYSAAVECSDPQCHEEQFNAWEQSKHANAYLSLLSADRAGVFDPEKNPRCINCHTLGYGDPDGGYLSSYKIPESRRGVSCGNCHGKSRTHIDRAYELEDEGKLIDVDVFPEIRKPDITTCIKCHDAENDSHFFDQNENMKENFKHKLKEISEYKDYKHFNFDKTWAQYIKSNWSKKYGKFDKKE